MFLLEKFLITPGKDNSIRITLDLHSNFLSTGTANGVVEGFKIFIGESTAYPRLTKYGLNVQPGKEYFFSLSNTILTADPAIRSINPKR